MASPIWPSIDFKTDLKSETIGVWAWCEIGSYVTIYNTVVKSQTKTIPKLDLFLWLCCGTVLWKRQKFAIGQYGLPFKQIHYIFIFFNLLLVINQCFFTHRFCKQSNWIKCNTMAVSAYCFLDGIIRMLKNSSKLVRCKTQSKSTVCCSLLWTLLDSGMFPHGEVNINVCWIFI